VLTKNYQHQTQAKAPSPRRQLRVDSIMKLVVNLLKCSAIDKLADLFPIISILLLFLYNHFVFVEQEGSLDHFLLCIFLKPSPVQLDPVFIAGHDSNFCKVYVFGVGRKREKTDFFFVSRGFLTLTEFIHEFAVLFVCVFDGLLLLDDS
jgi:hypothetical protein